MCGPARPCELCVRADRDAEPRGGGADGPRHRSVASLPVSVKTSRHHERGHGAQRGEPQHPSDEQQGHVAVVRPGHRPPAHHPAQHSLRQRTRGLDSHQSHPQSVHVSATAHGQRDALRDPRSGQGSPPHALGADGLRHTVHRVAQVPHHHAHCPVYSNQLLHQIRPDPFCGQHSFLAHCPHP